MKGFKVPRSEAEKELQREKRRVNMAKEQEAMTRLLRALVGSGVPVQGFVRGLKFYGEKTAHPWKFDLAHEGKLIAIEIDGGSYSGKPCPLCGMRTGGRHSHGAREAERLKLNTAASFGWRVFSFTTQAIEREPEACARLVRRAYS